MTFAAITLGFMVLVILWGAVVRATGSGAGCGDNWPRCNGTWVPLHPRLTTIIEFTHRSMSGICTTLVAVLLGWIFWATPRGHAARKPAVLSGVLLITEALLGAVLVLGGYVQQNASAARVVMQCVHFTNTMLLVAALTVTWWRLRRDVHPPQPTQGTVSRTTVWIALLATVAAGATGSVAALADTLFPSPSLAAGFASDFAANAPLMIRTRWVHPAMALISVLCVVLMATRLRGSAARWLLSFVALQIALGVCDLLLLTPITLQVLHLLGADLYWITLVAAASEAFRHSAATESSTVSTHQHLTA